jgi:hypothetical protein
MDVYACLGPDLHWQVLRGIRYQGIESSRRPGAAGNYVYLKLTDGALCRIGRDSKPDIPHIGDYVFQGFCDDNTFYYTRFVGAEPPTDAASPYGEGTDPEGRWLIKTSDGSGQLVTRAVAAAYR